jgi:hypothetical protein
MKSIKHLLSATLLVATLSLVQSVDAGSSKILPRNSHAFGTTYAKLQTQWWLWALGLPLDENPVIDTAPWNHGQEPAKVMFLANHFFSGTYERHVTVPTGTALFFPLANAFWLTVFPEEPSDEPTIRAILAEVMDQTTDLSLKIDGQPVTNLAALRGQSEIFQVDVTAGTLLSFAGLPDGTYGPAVDDGWYVLLAPLSAGKHTIHFTSNIPLFPTVLDITYHVTVAGGKK